MPNSKTGTTEQQVSLPQTSRIGCWLALAGLALLLALLGGLALVPGPSQAHVAVQPTSATSVTALLPIIHRNYPPPPSPADLHITTLYYESRDEYVEITNSGGLAQEMTGWRLYSVEGDQTFDFPAGYTLDAGASVRIHSGPDALDNPPGDLLWSAAYLWNNEGDEAVLYDAGDQEVDSACYLDGCP